MYMKNIKNEKLNTVKILILGFELVRDFTS